MPPTGSVTISATLNGAGGVSGSHTESLLNPVPVLKSATATQIGSTANYVVDVIGSSFVSNSVITTNWLSQTTAFVSANELRATVPVTPGTSTLAVSVITPDPGTSASTSVQIAVSSPPATSNPSTSSTRILDQTSFGPTDNSIAHLQKIGTSGYLAEQFAAPTTLLAECPAAGPYQCEDSEWWQTAITGQDQLRQRVAFALSEMFVVSTLSLPRASIPLYHNTLANDAFGNFRTLMRDVTLTPAMGIYLDMIYSVKPAPGQIANENYAREMLQLFTLGVNELNPDGTEQLDESGAPIPAYTEANVQAFARAYTGWGYAGDLDYSDPMVPLDSGSHPLYNKHDTTAKTLINSTLPAGQTAIQDLDGAMDDIFNHPNVGPFVCRQLIQHLVTSTPSPAYVGRVAAVFADNGQGVRGDMRAVISAILLDTEARAGDLNADADDGHLREPILFITAMMRALNFTVTDPTALFPYDELSALSSTLGEDPYRASSVFNFFPAEYELPGTNMNAPEFGIENTATATLRLSLADTIVSNKIPGFSADLSSTSEFGQLASNPSDLVDELSVLLMNGQMPANMRAAIVDAVSAIAVPATPQTAASSALAQRVRLAIYLVITSSHYKVIH
nr:DUF1800 domain-containing protein [Granulicella aggregans]